MKRKIIALFIAFMMLLQVLATPVIAIEEVIKENLEENSQVEVTEEKQEDELTETENVEIEKEEIVMDSEVIESSMLKEPGDEPVTINDYNLKEDILSRLVADGRILTDDRETHIITVSDMASLTLLGVYDAYDLTGLEYAINLEALEIGYYSNNSFDLALLSGMKNLSNFSISGNYLRSVQNMQVLNALNLKTSEEDDRDTTIIAEFDFESQSYIYDNISEFKKINRSDDLILVLNQDYEDWDVDLQTLIDGLAELKGHVKRIIYDPMLRSVTYPVPLGKGVSVSVDFADISPIFHDYILNTESVFYRELTAVTSDDFEVSFGNKELTITTGIDDDYGMHNGYINLSYYYYYNDEIYNSGTSMDVCVNYKVARFPDDIYPIPINDENLRTQLLEYYDIDCDGEITSLDIINITNLLVSNVTDFTGLEYAVNLEELIVDADSILTSFDFSTVTNMNNLRYLEVRNINELDNIGVLNTLDSIENVNLSFNNPLAIVELANLESSNSFIVFVGLQDNSDDELVYEIAKFLDNRNDEISCTATNIYFNDLYKDIEVGDPIVVGESMGPMDYTEYPIFGEFVMNPESKFYNPNFAPETYSDSVIFDNTEHTLTVTSKESDMPGKITVYAYYRDPQNNSREFRITYTLIPAGDYTTPLEIPDPELKRVLCDEYDINDDREMSPGEMSAINWLHISEDIQSYEGLQYATNLQNLEISNSFGGDVNFDLSLLEGMTNLQYLSIRDINTLSGGEALTLFTGLTNLNKANFGFKNANALSNSISTLELINRPSDFILYIDVSNNLNDATIDTLATNLEGLKDNVNGIYFSPLLYQRNLEERVPSGGERVYTFDEVNPFLNKYILNSNSVFYNSNPQFTPSNNEVLSIDMINKTITIRSNSPEDVGSRFEWFEYRYGNSTYRFYVSYYIVLDGDHETEIPVPDQNLYAYILANFDADHNDKITEYDLQNIDAINMGNSVGDLEGLQYATNLTSLSINGKDGVILHQEVLSSLDNLRNVNLFNVNAVDFSVFANMKSLDRLNVSGLTSISRENVANLNNLNGTNGRSNLEWIELSFREKSEIAKLDALTDHEYLILIIGLENQNYNEPIPAEDISDVVGYIETFSVSKVLFKDITQDYHPAAYSPNEEVIEITLDEICPWINYMRTESESNLYFPDIEIERFLPGEIDIEYDEEAEKIIVHPDPEQTGTFRVDFDIIYPTGEYSTYRIHFSAYIKIMAEGRIDFEVNVTDPNLRQLLIDEYNFDGNEMISEYDMFNIEDLETDFTEIYDLTGLEYAINLAEIHMNNVHVTDFSPLANLDKLRSISIANYQVEGEEDFSAFVNLPSLENFWIGTDSEFDLQILQNNRELRNVSLQAERVNNIQALNNLPCLSNVHLTVGNINGLDGLENLSIADEENSRVEIEINNYNNEEPYTEEEYNNILTAINSLKTRINKVKLNVSQAVVNLGDILVSDEPFVLDFEDINPLVNALINEESPLYRPNVSLYKTERYFYNTNNEDLTVDTEHKQLIFNITNVGENFVVVQLGNEDIWQDTNDQVEINCTIIIKYNTIVDGDKTKLYDENDIPDENLRRRLEEDYNFDGEEGISDYDMKNISELYVFGVNDYTGLEYATYLRKLCTDVSHNTDLSKVRELQTLEELELDLFDSEIDLTPIANLAQLRTLRLYAYVADDEIFGYNINPIISLLTNIEELSISYKMNNLIGITNLNNLKVLNIVMPEDGNLTQVFNKANLEDVSIYYIDKNVNFENFNNLQNLRNLRLNFKNAEAMDGLEEINTNQTYLNIEYYPDQNVLDEEVQAFLNVINKFKNKNNSNINFRITQEIESLPVNGNKTYTYNEISKVLGETLDPNSKLYGATVSNNDMEGASITLDTNEKTINISAGEEIGNKSCSVSVDGNRIYGRVVFAYTVYTNAGSTTKIYDKNDIPDDNLRRRLEEDYNIDGEEGFSERDMLNLTELDLYQADVEDLTGLEYAENLKEIYAAANRIESIEPLMDLEKLEWVELQSNKITDITCLANREFEFIRALVLEDNFIDFSNGSENLRVLEQEINKDRQKEGYYENSPIGRIIATQKVGNPDDFDNEIIFGDARVEQKLIELGVPTNINGKITRKALYDATYEYGENRPLITRLDLSNMELSDLTGLEYLGQIQELDLSHNNISNINQLKYLYNLKDLNLSNNNISDLSPLSKYIGSANTGDRTMNYCFAFNQISSIEPLNNWYILTAIRMPTYMEVGTYRNVSIDLAENNITSIAGLESWKNLEWLDLASNNISDITNLTNYNFTVWPDAESYTNNPEDVMQLNRFRGIQLVNQNPALDLNAQGTKDAKAVFDEKQVQLILEDDGPHFILGDVNDDGEVDPTDAKLILRCYVGKETLTPEQLVRANVNHDNEVDPTDAKLILRFYVGKIENFD